MGGGIACRVSCFAIFHLLSLSPSNLVSILLAPRPHRVFFIRVLKILTEILILAQQALSHTTEPFPFLSPFIYLFIHLMSAL